MPFGFLLTGVPRLLDFVNQEDEKKLERPTEDWLANSILPGKDINKNSHCVEPDLLFSAPVSSAL